MTRSILGRAAFSAVVAVALAFGARQAVASPTAQAARPFCEDDADCQATCERIYPGYEGIGYCTTGHTCFC